MNATPAASVHASCDLADETAQLACGRALAPYLAGRSGLIFLQGELGSGKTTLVRGLLRGLGVTGPVRSPTYTLVEPYTITLAPGSAPWPVFHLDLYRLASAAELDSLGWRDLIATGGLLFIEWPERAAAQLPPPQLWCQLHTHAAGRRLTLTAQPDWAAVCAAIHQIDSV